MTPRSRDGLAAMLDAVKLQAEGRQQRIAAAPDLLLQKVLGIKDSAICRRIAARTRLAGRIDGLLQDAAKHEAAEAAFLSASTVEVSSGLAQERPAQGFADLDGVSVSDQTPPVDFHLIMDRISAAIMVSTFGAMFDRRQISSVIEHFGAGAVAFGLDARRQVPEWMSAGAGGRIDVLRQFAATCIAALARVSVRQDLTLLIAEAAPYDPIPILNADACEHAAALAEAAIDYSDIYPDMEAESADVVHA